MRTFIQGLFIGIANIIPGVSGGTVALLLGIYERMIQSIILINVTLLKKILSFFKHRSFETLVKDLKEHEVPFVTLIGVGAIFSIVATSKLMTYLLNVHHEATYGFFFGLILFSVILPYKMLKRKSFRELITFLLGMALVIFFSLQLSPEQKIKNAEAKQMIKSEPSSRSSWITIQPIKPARAAFIFTAGFVAISAMILPGISGSFMLLLFGVYFDVLKAIVERDLVVVSLIGLGCIFGLLVFSRFLKWVFHHFYNETIAFLLGLILGSLYELWPFKTTAVVGEKTLFLKNTFDLTFSKVTLTTFLTFILGSAIVLFFTLYEKKKVQSAQG